MKLNFWWVPIMYSFLTNFFNLEVLGFCHLLNMLHEHRKSLFLGLPLPFFLLHGNKNSPLYYSFYYYPNWLYKFRSRQTILLFPWGVKPGRVLLIFLRYYVNRFTIFLPEYLFLHKCSPYLSSLMYERLLNPPKCLLTKSSCPWILLFNRSFYGPKLES